MNDKHKEPSTISDEQRRHFGQILDQFATEPQTLREFGRLLVEEGRKEALDYMHIREEDVNDLLLYLKEVRLTPELKEKVEDRYWLRP